MNQSVNETLSQVAEEVLESLAFVLLAFAEEDGEASPNESLLAACIPFDGPFSGTLWLRLPAAILEEASVNMLGLDFGECTTEEQQDDAFRELVNVICGNLLPRVAGDEAIFNIGVATVDRGGGLAPPLGQSRIGEARLLLEGGVAELSFFTHDVDWQSKTAA